MDYSWTKANPPHLFTNVEAVALEDVVDYLERATTKALWGDRSAWKVKGTDNKD
jgi:hypothetical protein